jgi:hypothetical protein
MNGNIKRIITGSSIVVLSALVLWLASHALRSESFMAVTPVQIESQQDQLDRMEKKIDWLVQYQIQIHEE